MEQAKTLKAVYFGMQHACERCDGQDGCICQIGPCYAKANEVSSEKPLRIVMLSEKPSQKNQGQVKRYALDPPKPNPRGAECRMWDCSCCIASGTFQKLYSLMLPKDDNKPLIIDKDVGRL